MDKQEAGPSASEQAGVKQTKQKWTRDDYREVTESYYTVL